MSWSVFGHDEVVKILKNHIIQDDTRHAYLFAGIPGIGRRSLAVQFAQALNCTQPPAPGDFCGECRACRQIAAQQHPDLNIVQADAVGSILKIDEIRELQHVLSLGPYEAKWRIALLLRFEEANQNAQNSLLKTLEEPADKVKLLLTASSENAVLPTISSRCEVIRLRPAHPENLADYLNANYAGDPASFEKVAHLSAGRTGVAISLMQDSQKAAWMVETAGELLTLFSQNTRERFQFAAAYRDFKKRGDLREVLKIWQSLARDMLLLSAEDRYAAQTLTFLELRPETERTAASLTPKQVRMFAWSISQALEYLNANVSPQLLLEELLLNIPAPER